MLVLGFVKLVSKFWYSVYLQKFLIAFLHLFPQAAFWFESEMLSCPVSCYSISITGFGLNVTEFQILIPQHVLLPCLSSLAIFRTTLVTSHAAYHHKSTNLSVSDCQYVDMCLPCLDSPPVPRHGQLLAGLHGASVW
jgi:hypothetical protein